MIKNIVFDLGGVIIPLNRIACIRAFDEIIGYKEAAKFLSSYRNMGFFEKFDIGEINARQFRQIVRANSTTIENGRAKGPTDSEIDYSMNRYLCDIPQDKIETLLFYKHDYNLYMLSNTNPICIEKSREFFLDKGYKMEELFVKCYLSFELGYAKPDRAIFDKMLKKAKIKPEETLFIDDFPANIEMASGLGFKTILYNPKDSLYDCISEFFERE